MDASDDELIAEIARGSQAALEAFYLRHETPLYNFLRSILRDDAQAADLVNEAMFDVWQKADRFEGRSEPRTWLYAIARNRALDRLRRVDRRSAEELDAEMPDENAEPADLRLMRAEDAGRVSHCLETIRPNHREVLSLAFLSDMPLAEIAGVLACPEGTVKSRIHHAKQAMRHCLESLARRRR